MEHFHLGTLNPDLDQWSGLDPLPLFQTTHWILVMLITVGIFVQVGIKSQILNYCWFHAPED